MIEINKYKNIVSIHLNEYTILIFIINKIYAIINMLTLLND
jgi:hypothetical protein